MQGSVRIEIQTDRARVFPSSGGSNGGFQPIDTLCSYSNIGVSSGAKTAASEMSMAIDAATRIRFRGVCHVHALFTPGTR